jgi:hypothetical protein
MYQFFSKKEVDEAKIDNKLIVNAKISASA